MLQTHARTAARNPAAHAVSAARRGSRGAVCARVRAMDYRQLLDVAKQSAEAGAEVVKSALDKPRVVTLKGVADLVTETDQASEDACVEVVRAAYPEHAILGEEGGISGDPSKGYLWCIDPIDGTTNFTHNYPSFAVSVAVLRHAIPVASCVIEFVGGPMAWNTRTFTAFRNGGAFCNGSPISVSKVKDVRSSLLVTGFGYEHDEPWQTNMELFKEFTDISQGVRRLGSAAVDLCHVAMGMSDAYWEFRLKPWDVAGGVLMVEEAGGLVTTMRGTAYTVFERSLLASNDSVHTALLEKIEPATSALLEEGVDLSPWFIPKGYSLHGGSQLN